MDVQTDRSIPIVSKNLFVANLKKKKMQQMGFKYIQIYLWKLGSSFIHTIIIHSFIFFSLQFLPSSNRFNSIETVGEAGISSGLLLMVFMRAI
jgi:hypothetical protein